MAVSCLPFPTRLVAESLSQPDRVERAAVVLYGGWLLVISILFSALWRSVSRDRELGGITTAARVRDDRKTGETA